jgi:hypothetical protein
MLPREFTRQETSALLPTGDIEVWGYAICSFLDGEYYPALKLAVKMPEAAETATDMTRFYEELV